MTIIRNLLARFSDNKYRVLIFTLLAGGSLVSIAIWRMRVVLTGSLHFDFLVWNLFLAWVPFGIAYFAYTLTLKRTWLYILIPAAALLWLIFFPNAPYILTDFQHLQFSGTDSPVWFDVLLLIWFAFTALLLGIVSLFLMQEIVRREFGRGPGWLFVVTVSLLSSAGIYMGRFLRWNSWDLLVQPADIALYTAKKVFNPSLQSIVFTGLFGAFFLFLYITLYTFAHLLLEHRLDRPSRP